jgi:hypothetical protein
MRAVPARMLAPLLAAVSVFAIACASPPEAEKKAADQAVSSATSAGAEKYAPSEFAAMTAAMKKAESEMSSKAYKEAKTSYESAKDLADKAAKAAEAGKAAAKAEAEKQIADLEARWKDVQAKAEASAKKLKADQKAVWDADAKTIADGLDAARSAAATDAALAKEKLAAIPALLDKWDADLAALAAPAKDEKKAAAKK